MSGPTVVLDTGIFVGAKNPHEAEDADCARLLDLPHDRRFRPVLSAITVAEVCTGDRLEHDERGRQVFLDYVRTADVFVLQRVDLGVADAAARVREEFGLHLPDALVVGTGIVSDAEFVLTYDSALEKSSGTLPNLSARALLARSR